MSRVLKTVISVFGDGTVEAVEAAALQAAVQVAANEPQPGAGDDVSTFVPGQSKVGDKVWAADGKTVLTVVAGDPSALEQIMTRTISVNAGKENPNYSTGEREVRARIAPGEYDYPMPTKRTVYELTRQTAGTAYAIRFAGATGKVRVELAGDPGGEVTGGVSLGIDGVALDGKDGRQHGQAEGPLQAFRKEITVSGTLNVNLRLDGGAPTVLLIVTPL